MIRRAIGGFAWLSLLGACGAPLAPPPPPISIAVEPNPVTMNSCAHVQLVATVANDRGDAGVDWSTAFQPPDSNAGGVTPEGLVGSGARVTGGDFTVLATSRADPSVNVRVPVSVLPPGMSIAPSDVTVAPGGSVHFDISYAHLDGCREYAFDLEGNGTIDAQGNYVAPADAGTYDVIAYMTSPATRNLPDQVFATVHVQ